MATKPSGIAGLNTNTNTRTYLDTLASLRTTEAQRAIQPSPDMNVVRQRQAEYANYLGQTDYAKQLEESQNMGKLQLALALAQRGFAAAGATPKRGESSVSTLSRELLSPLAGDAGSVAGRMMQQKQAINAAKTAEERQLKLAALQKVEAENTRLGDLAYKLMPKPKTAGEKAPFESVKYIVRRTSGVDGEPDTFGFTGSGGAAVQVRQERGVSGQLGSPLNVIGGKPVALEPGDEIVTFANLPDKLKGTVAKTSGSTASLGTVDYRLVYDKGPNEGKPYQADGRTPIFGTITKAGSDLPVGSLVERGGRGEAFDPKKIKTEGLRVEKIVKPAAAATPKGLDDPKFQASFRGMVARIGDLQERRGLGETAIRFNPVKFAANPGLKPGANYPFERFVGVNQEDGSVVTAPLTEDQQKTYADNLRAGYLNVFDAIKTGDQKTEDLNNVFIGRELRKSFTALGLPDAVQLPAGVVRGRKQTTNSTAITKAYKDAVPGFATDVQGTLNNLPTPRSDQNLRSGTGRLVLFNELGVNFGPGTVSPQPLAPDANAAAVVGRRNQIRGLDAAGIQERILAEKIAKGTQVGSKLRTATADSEGKKLTVVGEAFEKEREKLAKAMSSPSAAKDAETLDKSLEMLTRLQKLDYDLKQSGVTGFIRGPTEGILQQYLGIDVRKHFGSAEGQKAAASFIQSLPVTQQLFARDILRQAGEQRFTNKDLEGAQTTLVKLGQSGGFNAGTLRELTGYLKSLVKSGLSAAGTMDISPATLEKAAMLGIDLKSITPKNSFYSPYFNQGKYAVTNQPIPQYSKQYMDGLRDNGIFGYAAMRGTTGGAPMYKLIAVNDNTGLPIPIDSNNPKKGFQTVVVSGAGDWKADLKKKMLDYNRNYLLKTYGLDR